MRKSEPCRRGRTTTAQRQQRSGTRSELAQRRHANNQATRGLRPPDLSGCARTRPRDSCKSNAGGVRAKIPLPPTGRLIANRSVVITVESGWWSFAHRFVNRYACSATFTKCQFGPFAVRLKDDVGVAWFDGCEAEWLTNEKAQPTQWFGRD
jgi:hypothetical protein